MHARGNIDHDTSNHIVIINNIADHYITKVHLLIHCASVVIAVYCIYFEDCSVMSTAISILAWYSGDFTTQQLK